jgi:Uma2 family endonuclease
MNDLTPRRRETTQAAEGLPRLKWSLAEFERLTELGIFTEDDRIELIGGELIPMSPKGIQHEVVRSELLDWLIRAKPEFARVFSELGWRPDGDTYLEPDFLLAPASVEVPRIPPSAVLLLIEVARTSLDYDLGVKAATYARLGVRDYWVVDAKTRTVTVHREPSDQGYRAVEAKPATDVAEALLLPGLRLRIADLTAARGAS